MLSSAMVVISSWVQLPCARRAPGYLAARRLGCHRPGAPGQKAHDEAQSESDRDGDQRIALDLVLKGALRPFGRPGCGCECVGAHVDALFQYACPTTLIS